MRAQCFVSMLILVSSVGVLAQKDPALQSGKTQTQELLRDPKRVEKEGLHSPEAKAAHENAKSLMGSEENTKELYGLVSEIFGTMCEKSECEPQKMMQIMADLQKNPKSLKDKVTPDQWRRIEELAKKVEKRQPSVAPRN